MGLVPENIYYTGASCDTIGTAFAVCSKPDTSIVITAADKRLSPTKSISWGTLIGEIGATLHETGRAR